MSGIDEQRLTDLKVRIFFNIADLADALKNEDFKGGEVLFLDEEITISTHPPGYFTRLLNLRNLGRTKNLLVLNRWDVLKETMKTVKRLGLETFRKDWMGL